MGVQERITGIYLSTTGFWLGISSDNVLELSVV